MRNYWNPYRPNESKYHARKVTVPEGTFDSEHEYRRWLILKDMQRCKEITNLRRQVVYELIPAQYEPSKIGPRGGVKKGKCIETSCKYIADFVYEKDGITVVEDAKGFKTKEYIIKRKLMLQKYGIRITEV